MNNRSIFMLEGPILPAIIKYTIPIILTNLLQVAFNAADLVVVGRYCGSVSVAAVGATGSITHLLLNLLIGISIGTGVCVAHGIGCDNAERVRRTVHTAIPASVICGLALALVGFFFSNSFLTLMKTPSAVLPLSTIYMQIYFLGAPFTLLYNFSSSILRAAGDTKTPLIYLSISGVLNVFLNVIFVTLFNMNVAGVAIATITAQAVSSFFVTRALTKRTDMCHLNLKELKIYFNELRQIIRIGLPAGIQSSLFAISNVIIQSSINSFGEIFVSGSSAASNIEGFVYVAINAFSQTSVNFIGQNTGAKKYSRIKKIYWICIACATVTGIVLGWTVFIFGRQLLSIYITDSLQAIEYGIGRLGFLLLPYFICGANDITTGALRGIGSSLVPMIISILGICGLRLLWIFTIFRIPAFHTPDVLFASYPISWCLTLIVEYIAFSVIFKKLKNQTTSLEI